MKIVSSTSAVFCRSFRGTRKKHLCSSEHLFMLWNVHYKRKCIM